jgi:hypothetical protein
MGDPQGQRHRPRAAAGRADLSQFLRSQAEAILACDFFTADLLDGTQAYVLTVIGHASRRIRILGVTPHPTGEWTTQQARNLIMDLGEQAHRIKFMIRDRVHRVAGSGRQAPGQAPWPGETHVRQLLLPPDNANGGHGRLPPVTPGTLAAVGG